ncbi:MAG: serine/threonine-protein kinase [Clostridia bacterium]|nr:serine/threonine-protein kinase [Clostridia bacterium]
MKLQNLPLCVKDTDGQDYPVPQDVRGGGQGIFFPSGKLAVKILFPKQYTLDQKLEAGEAEYQKFQRKLIHLMAMPYLEHVSMPIVALKAPYCGYVMRFMDGLKPLSDFMKPASEKEGGYAKTYAAESCDLKKRILVLRNLADLLRKIHTSGLVYCDLTPGNVFVSEKNSEAEVWLIDVDNIEYGNVLQSHWQTPWYRAPEVYGGQRNSVYSDCYSFALIAFEFLTSSRPFDGKMAEVLENESGWDDETEWSTSPQTEESTAQKKIESGEMPYVDESCTKNMQLFGLPLQCAMTPAMQELFLLTLGKEGRQNPASRPSMNEWFHVFDMAIDQLRCCSKGHAHLGNACFLCKEKQTGEKERVLTVYRRIFYAVSPPVRSENEEVDQLKEDKRKIYEVRFAKKTQQRGKKDEYELAVPWKCFADAQAEHRPDACAVTLKLGMNDEKIKAAHCYDAKLKAAIKNISDKDTVFIAFKDRFYYELVVEEVTTEDVASGNKGTV